MSALDWLPYSIELQLNDCLLTVCLCQTSSTMDLAHTCEPASLIAQLDFKIFVAAPLCTWPDPLLLVDVTVAVQQFQ